MSAGRQDLEQGLGGMTFNLQLVAILFTLLWISSSASSLADPPSKEDYIFDVVQKHPKIQEAWSWIVPPSFKKHNWLNDLTLATSGPFDRVILSGRRFILGWACWPRNCGGNYIVFLIAIDGSEAYGLLSSQGLNIAETLFGVPDKEKTVLMRRVLNDIYGE